MITNFFFDSAETVDDFNLANNSWIKVLSSFNNETTCQRQLYNQRWRKIPMAQYLWTAEFKILTIALFEWIIALRLATVASSIALGKTKS